MKTTIHPTYYPEAKITCACGEVYMIGSTMEVIDVELCAKCHPFFTGKQKILDSAHRVEKFATRTSQKQDDVKSKATKNAERAAKRKPKVEIEETKSVRVKKAKQILGAGVIGLVIIMAAYAIASFVIGQLSSTTGTLPAVE